ncbi:hypothetical protein D3C76_1619080 [compost metagenome]
MPRGASAAINNAAVVLASAAHGQTLSLLHGGGADVVFTWQPEEPTVVLCEVNGGLHSSAVVGHVSGDCRELFWCYEVSAG